MYGDKIKLIDRRPCSGCVHSYQTIGPAFCGLHCIEGTNKARLAASVRLPGEACGPDGRDFEKRSETPQPGAKIIAFPGARA